ncbi:MAG: CIA30 family protein [Cyanobacteria bacterium P01_F01_bin.150]
MQNRYKTSSSRWDICQFFRTLAYFGVIPLFSRVGWIQSLLGSEVNPVIQNVGYVQKGDIEKEQVQDDEMMIFDFSQSNNQTDDALQSVWGPVDDVVMGGVSSSRLQAAAGSVVFTGTVSTSNSGGFVSVRTRNFDPPFDLSAYQGIRLKVRGDGYRYKFLLRDAIQWDGIAYAYSFDTVMNEWITVDVPFDQMVPVFRARTMNDAPGINSEQIRAFQFMLSKFEYDGQLNPSFKPGSFELYVESVSGYGGL